MNIAIKIFSIIGIVLGSLAILDSMESGLSAFVGGAFILAWGIICLSEK
jgi:hypothetical protein